MRDWKDVAFTVLIGGLMATGCIAWGYIMYWILAK